MMNYSVLMSVYCKEKAEYLKEAIESIQRQTVPTNNFVLVCDGPLTSELDAVILQKQRELGNILNVVRLKKNNGLGKALNIGLKYCENDLIARMDSDDISFADRCERQLEVFKKQTDISICSGTVEEFFESVDITDAKRVLPEKHKDIVEFAKKRNPFNHPCVMYKKTAVEAAGSYQDFYLLEDYYLWIRMLLKGFKGYNIQQALLHMRAGSGMYKRRAGWEYAKSQINLFRFMKQENFITSWQFMQSCILRGCSSMAPNWLRKFMFEKVLRK